MVALSSGDVPDMGVVNVPFFAPMVSKNAFLQPFIAPWGRRRPPVGPSFTGS